VSKKVVVEFEEDIYSFMLKGLPVILPGVRGNSTKNKRIRNKILSQNLSTIIRYAIEYVQQEADEA
jgi:hypothetical protein